MALEQFKQKFRHLKSELRVLYLAYRHPKAPWYAKLLGVIVIGYALSPIDLIPDFVPILGYLDDLILLPLGIALMIKLIPSEILEECRKEAEDVFNEGKPRNYWAGAVIIGLWVFVLGLIIYLIVSD